MQNKNENKIIIVSPFGKYIKWGRRILSIPSPITIIIMIIRLIYVSIVNWELIIYLFFPITGLFLLFYGIIRNRRFIKRIENSHNTK